MFTAFAPIFVLLAAAYVRAEPNPNNPGPGDVVIEGKPCMIGWDIDPTGVWKAMDIDLMTGNNFDMVFLTAVATVDATDPSKNTFSFACPKVTPHSPIYFYQFSSPNTSNKTWTGRFTITDSAKNVVPPSQSTQPGGEKIPWGTGSLVNGSRSSTCMTSRCDGAPSGSPISTPLITSGSTSPSDTSTSAVVSVTTDVASTTPSTDFTAGANGAVGVFGVSDIVFQTGLALGLAALGFTLTF